MYQLKLGGKNRKEAKTTTGLPRGSLAPFSISLGRTTCLSCTETYLLASVLLSSLLQAMEWIMINVHIMQPVHIITRPDCLIISLICRPFVSWLFYFWPLSSQHPQFSQTKLNHTPAVPQKTEESSFSSLVPLVHAVYPVLYIPPFISPPISHWFLKLAQESSFLRFPNPCSILCYPPHYLHSFTYKDTVLSLSQYPVGSQTLKAGTVSFISITQTPVGGFL